MVIEKKVVKVLTGFLFFLVIALFLILLLTTVKFFSIEELEEEERKKNVNEYQTLVFNPSTGDKSFESMKIFDDLLEGEKYKSFINEEGNHVLISKPFGSEEYFCKGSCYCDEENHRSVTAINIIPKTLNYLLAAVSVLVASKLSEKYFHQECQEKMIDECPSTTEIKSEVLECKNVEEYSASSASSEVSEEDDPIKKMKYTCKGFCYPFAKYLKSDSILGDGENNLSETPLSENESVKYVAERYMSCSSVVLDEVDVSIMVEREGQKGNLRRVKKKFLHSHLLDFCTKNTRFNSQKDVQNVEQASKWIIQKIQNRGEPMGKTRLMHFLEQMEVFQDNRGDFLSWCSAVMQGETDPSYRNIKCKKKKK